MPDIIVREDESFEKALKRFRQSCQQSGLMTEIKKRQHYEKPSVKRKKKSERARKRMSKKYRGGGY
ncbi:MAG: 30S ribosomal protein S21 [Candidatus Hydrogenedentota bacterium]